MYSPLPYYTSNCCCGPCCNASPTNKKNANLPSLNPLKYPIAGFQATKRTCLKGVPRGKSCAQGKNCRKFAPNKLGLYSTIDMYQTQLYNSFNMQNVPCICCKPVNPNLTYRARLKPRPRKSLCCNICLPDGVANRIPNNCCNYCPPLKPGCSGSPASFTPVQNVCLLGPKNPNQ